MYALTHTGTHTRARAHTHTHACTRTRTHRVSRPAGRFANMFTFIDGTTTPSDGGEEIACLFVSVRGFCTAYARNWQNRL